MKFVAILVAAAFITLAAVSTTAQSTDPNIDPALAGITVKYVRVKLTGYCPEPPCVSGYYAQFRTTASGKPVEKGHCASDWKIYGRGSVFLVPGYGPCVVEDTGNLVEGEHLDLFFETYEEAAAFGYKKQAQVALVKYEKPCVGRPSRCAFRFEGDTVGYKR